MHGDYAPHEGDKGSAESEHWNTNNQALKCDDKRGIKSSISTNMRYSSVAGG